MAGGHTHSHTVGENQRSLSIALALTTTFLIVELAGGILTKSLALSTADGTQVQERLAFTMSPVGLSLRLRARA